MNWPLKTSDPLSIKARVAYTVQKGRVVDYALSYVHLWNLVDYHSVVFVEFIGWQFNVRDRNDET